MPAPLYGVAPQDPFILALATGLLVLVAFSAPEVPARRASRLDPMDRTRFLLVRPRAIISA
jgi:hypothetical protein